VSYVYTGSSLMLCFGLENFVDFFSSVIVLWRFYLPSGKADDARLAVLQQREKRASLAISMILGLLGIGVVISAAHDFTLGREDDKNLDILLIVSFVSILVFGVLTVIKFHYAWKLGSAALKKDGLCSLIGTVLSSSLFFDTILVMEIPQIWWIDPTIAMLCGLASLAIGFYSVMYALLQGVPIYNIKWWLNSTGDGSDEISGRQLEDADLATSANRDKDTNGGDTELTPRDELTGGEVV